MDIVAPQLRSSDLIQGDILFDAGDAIHQICFPESGVISLVVPLTSGEVIEAAMIGRDSLTGAMGLLDGGVSPNRGIVQIAGQGSFLDAAVLRGIVQNDVDLRARLARHQQAMFVQVQQSVACNASHKVEARLSRWLLRSRDLAGSDTLVLTQEFLAQMLGVRRTSVSLVANQLQQAGLIAYRRGTIQVLDLDGLREAACECYGTVKRQCDPLLNGEAM